MAQLLEYNYAVLNNEDKCVGVVTYSVQVPLDNYILIPSMDDYYGKYYDRETGIWYYDAEHTQVFEP